jgi:hypothetical protein
MVVKSGLPRASDPKSARHFRDTSDARFVRSGASFKAESHGHFSPTMLERQPDRRSFFGGFAEILSEALMLYVDRTLSIILAALTLGLLIKAAWAFW